MSFFMILKMNGILIFSIAAAIYLAMKEINALEIGAATATVLTAETEGLLDHEVYNGKVAEKALESKEASAA